jgi:hypothetical protein
MKVITAKPCGIHTTRENTYKAKERTNPCQLLYDIITTAERQVHVGQDGSMWGNYMHTPPSIIKLQMAGKVITNNHYDM